MPQLINLLQRLNMKNYNPISANTLVVKTIELEEFLSLKDHCLSGVSKITTSYCVIGDNTFNVTLRLITNYKHLEIFWKLNLRDGIEDTLKIKDEIIFIENNKTDDFIQKYDFQKFKYYNKELNSVISLNNDFYGNVKISYRGLCANAALSKDVLTLHSDCLNIQGKNIAITGDSGAGKSTLCNMLHKSFDGILVWEDFGLVNANDSRLIVPNEVYNQLNQRTLKNILPLFNESSTDLYSEYYDPDSLYYQERRLMVNISDYIKTIQNTKNIVSTGLDALIILKNDTTLPYSIRRASAKEALAVFAIPVMSKAHQGEIRYANGSLILDEEQDQLYYENFLKLFLGIKNLFILNNNFTSFDHKVIIDLINEN